MNRPPTLKDETAQLSFEASFERLEKILEKMSASAIGLDESLKLYEEADFLIAICSQRLNEAERKVEQLIKNRNGEINIGPDQQPMSRDFFSQ